MSINRSCLESNEFKDRNAFGCDTKACGQCSLSCGRETKAKGKGSFSKGYKTISFGDYSHSEGLLTESKGTSSHAEGTKLTSIDKFLKSFISNKEDIDGRTGGKKTIAIGTASHAEGAGTESSGNYSHSEGGATQSVGSCSHAEGLGSKAVGIASHAEGDPTLAIGNFSHAEGRETTSLGTASHSEGWNSISEGAYSHAEGVTTIARGNGSHSQGYNTIAGGKYSHASGSDIVVDGDYSHGIGKNLSITGDNVVGINNTSSTISINDSDSTYIDGGKIALNSKTSGNVGIGTSSPSEKLEVNGNIFLNDPTGPPKVIIRKDSFGSGEMGRIETGFFNINTNIVSYSDGINSGELAFEVPRLFSSIERMRINLFGDVGIGTSSPSEKLEVNGNVLADNFNTPSDERIKKDIKEVEKNEAIEIINNLKPKKYKYNKIYNSTEDEVYGFIAQEFKEVIDYAVKIYPEKLVKSKIYQDELAKIKNNKELTREEKVKQIKELNNNERLKLKNFHTMKKDVMFPLLVKNCQVLNNENKEMKDKILQLEQENLSIKNELSEIKNILNN